MPLSGVSIPVFNPRPRAPRERGAVFSIGGGRLAATSSDARERAQGPPTHAPQTQIRTVWWVSGFRLVSPVSALVWWVSSFGPQGPPHTRPANADPNCLVGVRFRPGFSGFRLIWWVSSFRLASPVSAWFGGCPVSAWLLRFPPRLVGVQFRPPHTPRKRRSELFGGCPVSAWLLRFPPDLVGVQFRPAGPAPTHAPQMPQTQFLAVWWVAGFGPS